MRIAPVFGPGALAVSPRVGLDLHVTVDEAPWRWTDASGRSAHPSGVAARSTHRVLIELVDANHQPVDKGTVAFDVPKKAAAHAASERKR